MMGLVLATMIGSIYAMPAFGKDKSKQKHEDNRYDNRDSKDYKDRDNDRGQRDYKGRDNDRGQRDYKGRDNDRGQRDYKGRDNDRGRKNNIGRYQYKGYDCYRIVNGRRVYRPCDDRKRDYYPPNAVYAPPPPRGIEIFFPPFFFPFTD